MVEVLVAMRNAAPKSSTNIDGAKGIRLGGSTRQPIMTAYRQQAVACAAALALAPARPRDLKPAMPDAPRVLLSNVYGWFVRVDCGIYTLSEVPSSASQPDIPLASSR